MLDSTVDATTSMSISPPTWQLQTGFIALIPRPIAAMTCLLFAIAGCAKESTMSKSTANETSTRSCDASSAVSSDGPSAGSPDTLAGRSLDALAAARSPAAIEDDGSAVVKLAIAQLKAYNAQDLDAFCAAYHDEVRVLDADGKESFAGIKNFREKYRPMFESGGFGATIDRRVVMAPHCIEREAWFRTDQKTGKKKTGTVLVRYTEKDGKIAVVQFLH